MSNRARRIKRLHGLDLIVVDYIQLMKGSFNNKDGRVQEISQITQGLKAIAKELGVPVLPFRNFQGKLNKEMIINPNYLIYVSLGLLNKMLM